MPETVVQETVVTDPAVPADGGTLDDDSTLLGGAYDDSNGEEPGKVGAEPVKDAPDNATAAPEKYELTLPEGFVLDETAMGEFEPILKELKATPEQAQSLADLYIRKMQEVRTNDHNIYAGEIKGWSEALKADPEIGGAKLEENLGHCIGVIKKYGTPEVKDILNASGMGSHPGIVKMLLNISKATREDSFVNPEPGFKAAVNTVEATAAVLYPNSLK